MAIPIPSERAPASFSDGRPHPFYPRAWWNQEVRERKNMLLSFGRAADHAAVAFVEFDVQVYTHGASLRCDY
jgi:hypothetical protein